jgi:hypothetical protein
LLGENTLMFGTDYAHNDASSQLTGHTTIMRRTDISESVRRKIVDSNARRAFGIDPDFCPTDQMGVQPGALPYVVSNNPNVGNERNVVGIGT